MQDHRKLRAFEVADRLAIAVYRCTKTFPHDEIFSLTNQLRRAAVSVPSNIVEGCSRSSKQEYLRFLEIALGSAQEVEYQLTLAHRLGYLGQDEAAQVEPLSSETCRTLNALLRSLRPTRTP